MYWCKPKIPYSSYLPISRPLGKAQIKTDRETKQITNLRFELQRNSKHHQIRTEAQYLAEEEDDRAGRDHQVRGCAAMALLSAFQRWGGREEVGIS